MIVTLRGTGSPAYATNSTIQVGDCPTLNARAK